jgi:hypothetical protein
MTGLAQTMAAWLAQPVPALVTLAGLTALGGVIWLFLYSQQLRNGNDLLLAQMRERDARQTESVVEIERKLAEERTRSDRLQQELEIEKRRRETRPPDRTPAFPSPMIVWSLSPLAVRGSGQASEALRLDRKAKTVALVIPDNGRRKYTGYKVELRIEDSGRTLLIDSQPYIPPARRGRDIVFYRSATEFEAASYKLTVTLISLQETTTRDYYFTVA